MQTPTRCHNCRHLLSASEIAEIESDPRVLEVVRYFGSASCNSCCDRAARHNVQLHDNYREAYRS